jgi:mannose-6-phosphate isomerase-like protein (cupin superfamily)
MTTAGSGFDMSDFLGALARMGDVQAGNARPLVVAAADLEPLPSDTTHSPASLKVAGTLPTRTFEIFRQVIHPGGTTDMQRHHHETVHFVIAGTGRSEIEDEEVTWSAGAFIYTPPWTWHRHYNTSATDDVDFLTIENSRLLGLLGLNRRQSAGMTDIHGARAWEERHDH